MHFVIAKNYTYFVNEIIFSFLFILKVILTIDD